MIQSAIAYRAMVPFSPPMSVGVVATAVGCCCLGPAADTMGGAGDIGI